MKDFAEALRDNLSRDTADREHPAYGARIIQYDPQPGIISWSPMVLSKLQDVISTSGPSYLALLPAL